MSVRGFRRPQVTQYTSSSSSYASVVRSNFNQNMGSNSSSNVRQPPSNYSSSTSDANLMNINKKLTDLVNICNENSRKITDIKTSQENINKSVEDINLKLTSMEVSITRNKDDIGRINVNLNEINDRININKTCIDTANKNLTTFTQKISTYFIDFFYICNPRQSYDDQTVESITAFINQLGAEKNKQFVKERLGNISSKNSSTNQPSNSTILKPATLRPNNK